ncbi:MAG: InlB B-repeat-containing protein, partial [Lachnospiraceae bacterium]|nr:InlB B-repeat-containing protein [Lachnospiraceae bacterium]
YTGADGLDNSANPASYTVEDAVTLSGLSKTGHTFNGWFENDTKITQIVKGTTGNKTLRADFSANSYSITYYPTGVVHPNPAGYTYGTQVVLQDASKGGYSFDGWYDAAAGGSKVTVIGKDEAGVPATSPYTVYAVFTPNTYSVSYNGIEGAAPEGEVKTSYTTGDSFAFHTMKKEGYTFEGWFDNAGTKIEGVTADTYGDLYLTAKWTEVKKQEPETGDTGKKDEGSSTTIGKDEIKTEEAAYKATEKQIEYVYARMKGQGKNKIKLSWPKNKKADGYLVYAAHCNYDGSKFYKDLVKVVKGGNTTSTVLTKINGKKLSGSYKVTIYAYKLVDGKYEIIGKSLGLHAPTEGGKYTSATSVKVNKKKVTLRLKNKKKKTFKIKAKEVAQNGLKIAQHRAIKFISKNTKVAKVDKNGKIKAVGRGTCTIYVVAQNGVYTKIKVTVK